LNSININVSDIEQQLIYETWCRHQARRGKIQTLRENFEDGAGSDFGKGGKSKTDSKDSDSKSDDSKSDDDDDKDDSDDKSEKDSDSSKSDSKSSKSDSKSSKSDSSTSSSSSSKPKSSSSKGETAVEKGKLSEEELDTELDALMSKKLKIQNLYDDDSIDDETARVALDKIRGITNALVSKFV
jgi:hypothetical protein